MCKMQVQSAQTVNEPERKVNIFLLSAHMMNINPFSNSTYSQHLGLV